MIQEKILAKKFYMIRHGQSVANEQQYFSGNLDVELTDLGRKQAESARQIAETLEEKPARIIHSHLKRARHTAEIINKNLKLPIEETPLLGEHHFGDWHGKPWNEIRPRFFGGENPPNGETHDEFMNRVCKGLNYVLKNEKLPLIVCHGGVFRAFNRLYNRQAKQIQNCVLYEFIPDQENETFPWKIKSY